MSEAWHFWARSKFKVKSGRRHIGEVNILGSLLFSGKNAKACFGRCWYKRVSLHVRHGKSPNWF